MDKLTILSTAAQMEFPLLLVPSMTHDAEDKQQFSVWCLACYDQHVRSGRRWTHDYHGPGIHLMADEVMDLFIVIDGSKYRDRICYCCEKEVFACASTT